MILVATCCGVLFSTFMIRSAFLAYASSRSLCSALAFDRSLSNGLLASFLSAFGAAFMRSIILSKFDFRYITVPILFKFLTL